MIGIRPISNAQGNNKMSVITGKSLQSAALGLSVIGLLPGMAAANQGWYLGLEGGANFLNDQTFRIYDADGLLVSAEDGTPVSTVSFDTGYVAGLVGGYAFGSGFKLELELARRDNDFDSVLLQNGQPSQRVGGREFADLAFANVWYDFFPSSRVHPYLGGGAGVARVAVRDPAVDNLGLFQDGSGLRGDFDAVFAWQAGGGLRFDLTRSLTASVDYRYLRSNIGHFDLLANNPQSHVRTRYESHAALLSLRYHFGAPPAAPAEAPTEAAQVVPVVEAPAEQAVAQPVPAPRCQPSGPDGEMELGGCAVGDVIVLHGVNFETAKSTLTLNAKALLDGVAIALGKHPGVKVAVQGHTDSRGSEAYNLRLSGQRAQAVRDYLIGKGIDAGRMTAAGFGETMPIADNTTEDGLELNRRVELKVVEREGAAQP